MIEEKNEMQGNMKKRCLIRLRGSQHFNAASDNFVSEMAQKGAPPSGKELEDAVEEALEENEAGEEERSLLRDLLGRIADPHETEPETELGTYGLLSNENGVWTISYEESEITGAAGVLTTICLLPSGMVMLLKRGGPEKTCLVFERGARHLCDYGARHSMPPVCLYTRALSFHMSESGGEIRIDYYIEIAGSKSEHNEFFITVEALNR